MIRKKWCSFILVITLLCTMLSFSFPFVAEAASGPSLQTTLQDNIIQKGSKKTFDVWARNGSGDKIKATVKFNGQKLSPTWDDEEKTSYTLLFTKEGENIVEISASSDGGKKIELVYHITYQKANPGESIGKAIWSIEAFTIGGGYLVYPVSVDIFEGETAADQLIRLLHNNGYVAYYGGTTKASFYIAYIADGTASQSTYSGYKKSGTASSPKKLNLSTSIPSVLVPYLEDTMTYFEPDDYEKNWKGYLGEFAITNGSGWMYSVNNIFPNVGFADTYLSDGDVVRVQFTLAYGADIGGAGSTAGETATGETMPSGFFSAANKDQLTSLIAKARTSGLLTKENMKKAYTAALQTVTKLNASQSEVNTAVSNLNAAFSNPGSETNTPPPESTSPSQNETSTDGTSQSGSGTAKPDSSTSPTDTSKDESIQGTESTGGSSESPSENISDTESTALDPTSQDETTLSDKEPSFPSGSGKNTSSGGSGWIGWLIGGIVIVCAGAGVAVAILYQKKKWIFANREDKDNGNIE